MIKTLERNLLLRDKLEKILETETNPDRIKNIKAYLKDLNLSNVNVKDVAQINNLSNLIDKFNITGYYDGKRKGGGKHISPEQVVIEAYQNLLGDCYKKAFESGPAFFAAIQVLSNENPADVKINTKIADFYTNIMKENVRPSQNNSHHKRSRN